MEAGGFGMIEATDAGLREGVFFETLLGDPPLVDDVRRATVRNLAAQYDADFAHVEHVAAARARALGRARRRRPPPRRPEGARAAVGHRDAARHRHRRRLRRPPQALALPDPLRGHAGLQPARGRADRPGRPLPPQGQPGPRRVLRARARRRRGAAEPARGRRPDRRAARALPRPGRPRLRRRSSTTATSSCACTPTRTSRSPAGPPSARATSSARRSAELSGRRWPERQLTAAAARAGSRSRGDRSARAP